MAESTVESRARNLFVISSAVIVYLLAGADVSQLSVLGLRTPAIYPIVFEVAAVMALVWFWWRYLMASLATRARNKHRNDFRFALRKLPQYQQFVISEVGHEKIANIGERVARRYKRAPNELTVHEVDCDAAEPFRAQITQVTFLLPDGGRIEASQNDFGAEPIIVPIPVWIHCKLAMPYYIWRSVRHESFADVILPHALFFGAIVLVAFKFFGVDPAGIFGLLEPPDRPAPATAWVWGSD